MVNNYYVRVERGNMLYYLVTVNYTTERNKNITTNRKTLLKEKYGDKFEIIEDDDRSFEIKIAGLTARFEKGRVFFVSESNDSLCEIVSMKEIFDIEDVSKVGYSRVNRYKMDGSEKYKYLESFSSGLSSRMITMSYEGIMFYETDEIDTLARFTVKSIQDGIEATIGIVEEELDPKFVSHLSKENIKTHFEFYYDFIEEVSSVGK